MTIYFPFWTIPLVLTAIIFGVLALQPAYKKSSAYDFGGPIVALMQVGAAVIATLLAWLVYFVIV